MEDKMKRRFVPVLVGALTMLLIVVAVGAAARTRSTSKARIPNGSIGLNKLSLKVRKLLAAKAGEGGPQGPPGTDGVMGPGGAMGPEGASSPGRVLTYSSEGDG
jgi:hypothetical protein